MEMLEMIFNDLTREELMMQFYTVSGAMMVASLVCTALCGIDPLGGFNLWHSSTEHCLAGLGAATPLILLRLWMWSDQTPPFVREYTIKRQSAMLVFLQRFSLEDAMTAALMLSFSFNFLIYPGLVGCLSSSLGTYLGMESTGVAGFDWILLGLGGMLGVGYSSCLAMDMEEQTVLYEAIKNADRYFRLTLPPNLPSPMARDHSNAFVKASLHYMETNKKACLFASLLTMAQTYYGGMLWKMTGDASTPICLFLCLALVEMFHLKSNE